MSSLIAKHSTQLKSKFNLNSNQVIKLLNQFTEFKDKVEENIKSFMGIKQVESSVIVEIIPRDVEVNAEEKLLKEEIKSP